MNTHNEFDYQILNLTGKFYTDYPNPPYTEIPQKGSRPYNCLLIQSRYGYFICVPYRSHIKHKNAYHFKNSIRSTQSNSGLDYSKMIIINNPDYITSKNAVIDQDEYIETRNNIHIIVKEAQKYIDKYITYITSTEKRDQINFERHYKFSTLRYFHNELGIS